MPNSEAHIFGRRQVTHEHRASSRGQETTTVGNPQGFSGTRSSSPPKCEFTKAKLLAHSFTAHSHPIERALAIDETSSLKVSLKALVLEQASRQEAHRLRGTSRKTRTAGAVIWSSVTKSNSNCDNYLLSARGRTNYHVR